MEEVKRLNQALLNLSQNVFLYILENFFPQQALGNESRFRNKSEQAPLSNSVINVYSSHAYDLRSSTTKITDKESDHDTTTVVSSFSLPIDSVMSAVICPERVAFLKPRKKKQLFFTERKTSKKK